MTQALRMLASLVAAVAIASSPQSQIANYLDTYANAGFLSGTVLVAKDDHVLFERSYGYADYENRVRNANDTRYNIASVTKWMTLTVLLQMVYNHEIVVSDKLEKYIPGIPNGNKITILDLLNHRAGLPHEFTDEAGSSVPRTAAEMAELAKTVTPAAEPGAKEIYSSAGFTLLARIIEIIKKKPFQQVLPESIFSPCGMTHTVDPEPFELVPKRAFSYMVVPGGVWRCTDTDYTHLVGAGSVFSSCHDLFLFVRAIWHEKLGKIVKANLLRSPLAFENGLTNGYRSFIQFDQNTGLTICFCGNTLTPAADRLREDIPLLLAGKSVTARLPEIPKPVPDPKLSDYAGVYSIGGEKARMHVRDGLLAFNDSALVPTGNDTFFGMRDFGTVKAFRKPDGAVDRLEWMEDGHVILTFTRE